MSHRLEVRYAGQDFSLPVSVDPTRYADSYRGTIRDAFHQLHQTRFGYHDADAALEIVNAHLVAHAPHARKALPAPARRSGPSLSGRRGVIFEAELVDCPVYQRESVESGQRIDGPAIVQEYASTTVLFPGDRAQVTATGELLIHVGGAQ
jgi:N-methylhydantoinase A